MSKLDSIIKGREYVKILEENYINIRIPFSLENQLIVERLFIELDKSNLKKLSKDCFFDEENCSILNSNNRIFLTKKELIFINLLLKNKTVTYEQMICYIWSDNYDITSNAVKLFVKNFKKKIPLRMLKNINGIGYKFVEIIC
jgi:DNA-binding response OmpR family regulator